jgi:thioredoxin-dependent peroxiredoxin
MLKVGQKAPDFRLRMDTDHEIAIEELKGKRVLLFFYPKADTPG